MFGIFLSGCGSSVSIDDLLAGRIVAHLTARSPDGTKVPIEGALCILEGTKRSATSDANGAVVFDGIQDGAYVLVCTKEDRAFIMAIEVRNGETKDLGTVELTTPPGNGMLCGNGKLDPGETCDPPASCPTSCIDDNVCTTDVLTGSAASCNSVCAHEPIVACVHGDGCCPGACTSSQDTDCEANTSEVYLAAQTAEVAEGVGKLDLIVNLSKPASFAIVAKWSAQGTDTFDGAQSTSYGSGPDFSPAAGAVTFAAGETSKIISLQIVDGTAAEPDQKLVVKLESVSSGAIRSSQDRAQVTIKDNDRSCLLDVTGLPASDPLGSSAGWGGASWNLNKTGVDGVNNTVKLKSILNFFATQHPQSAIVLFFPYGTYQLECESPNNVRPNLNYNKITLIGQSADPRTHPEGKHTILKYKTPYGYTSRMFDFTPVGWNSAHDSELNRFLLKHMVLDGDNTNCGGNFNTGPTPPWNGSTIIYFSGFAGDAIPGGRANGTIENSKIMNSAGGAIANFRNSNLRIWQVHIKDCLKSFYLSSGRNTTGHIYDIKVWGDVVAGGLHLEGYAPGNLSVYGKNWEVHDARNWICNPFGGVVELDNIYVGPCTHTLGSGLYVSHAWGNSYSNASHPDAHITVTNSEFHTPNYNRTNAGGVMNFTDCSFVSYTHPTDKGDVMSGTPYVNLGSNFETGDNQITYTNCTFSNNGTVPSGYVVAGCGYHGGSNGTANWSTYPDAFVKFDGCTFDSSLHSAWYPSYGSDGHLSHIFKDCIFEASNYNGKYCFETNNWSDGNAEGILKVINPTFNLGNNKIYYLKGGADDMQNMSWLFHSGTLTATQNDDSLGTQYGVNTISVGNAEVSAEISAIIKGSSTTTFSTVTSHGLETGNKVMFDGFHPTTNASWFSNLSPHSNSAVFTVTKISATQFSIGLNSSSFASYNASGDMAHVSKYPYRVITGGKANPVTAKPAGLVGDRYVYSGSNYRCVTSGPRGFSNWVAE